MAAGRDTLVASAAFTASGNSPSFPLTTATMLDVTVAITAGSGTVSDFDLWIEKSTDNGATWTRALADLIDANGTDVTTPRSNIVNNKASTAAETYGATYKHVPAALIRARWNLAGTTPSLTFSVTAAWK